MAKFGEMFAKHAPEGLLNHDQFKAFRRDQEAKDVENFGGAVIATDELVTEEYNLYNTLTPGIEGLSQLDMAASWTIFEKTAGALGFG